MESTLMSINLSISPPVELECPNCRVKVRLTGGSSARQICPYCGSWYDPDCPAAQLEGGSRPAGRLGSARPQVGGCKQLLLPWRGPPTTLPLL